MPRCGFPNLHKYTTSLPPVYNLIDISHPPPTTLSKVCVLANFLQNVTLEIEHRGQYLAKYGDEYEA